MCTQSNTIYYSSIYLYVNKGRREEDWSRDWSEDQERGEKTTVKSKRGLLWIDECAMN